MVRVGYFHCPVCLGERLFVAWEPPYDENLAGCEDCNYVYGYCVDQAARVENGRVVATATPRPVLSPETLRAGMKRYQDEVAARLLERHGGSAYAQAQRKLDEALASEDLAERRRLMQAQGPGALDRDLAARVLSPTVPRRP